MSRGCASPAQHPNQTRSSIHLRDNRSVCWEQRELVRQRVSVLPPMGFHITQQHFHFFRLLLNAPPPASRKSCPPPRPCRERLSAGHASARPLLSEWQPATHPGLGGFLRPQAYLSWSKSKFTSKTFTPGSPRIPKSGCVDVSRINAAPCFPPSNARGHPPGTEFRVAYS